MCSDLGQPYSGNQLKRPRSFDEHPAAVPRPPCLRSGSGSQGSLCEHWPWKLELSGCGSRRTSPDSHVPRSRSRRPASRPGQATEARPCALQPGPLGWPSLTPRSGPGSLATREASRACLRHRGRPREGHAPATSRPESAPSVLSCRLLPRPDAHALASRPRALPALLSTFPSSPR